MKVVSASAELSIDRKCVGCKSTLRLYAGDIQVQAFCANPSEAWFDCVACGKQNKLPCSRHVRTGLEVMKELKVK